MPVMIADISSVEKSEILHVIVEKEEKEVSAKQYEVSTHGRAPVVPLSVRSLLFFSLCCCPFLPPWFYIFLSSRSCPLWQLLPLG